METQKKCKLCTNIKDINEFYKHKGMLDGHLNKCKECAKSQGIQWRLDKIEHYREVDRNRHRYDISRIFTHRYGCIKNRSTMLRNNGKPYQVNGKEFLSKKEWTEWCYKEENYKQFIKIYNEWIQNNFEMKYSPSVDRIDNNGSYTADNIQWLNLTNNIKKYYKNDYTTRIRMAK